MEYIFKEDKRFLTRGVANEIPVEVQVLIWNEIDKLIESDIKVDYLQVFRIQVDKNTAIIKHHQEQPEFSNEFTIKLSSSLNFKEKILFIIDDITHCTMLLSSEY